MKFRYHFVIALVFAMLAPSATLAAGEVNVAFVQASRLLRESPQIRQLEVQVREEFAPRNKRLIEMQKLIKTLEDKLEQDGESLNPSEQRRLKHDIRTRRLKYKHARDELNQDRQLRFEEEKERIMRIIGEVIGQVAQDDKIDMVLQSGVLWFSPKVDITDKVLDRLRKLDEGAKK